MMVDIRARGADERFRDLHRVERGALAELIAADEQVEPHAFGLREVAADSSDVDGVAAAIASCDRKRRNCSATTSINSHAQIL